MRLAVIGTGYVGLVTGACFAELGHKVICADKDEAKISRLLQGEMPIYEDGLSDIVIRNVRNKKLSFTTSTEKATTESEVVFIAVDTPPKTNGQADLSKIEEAAVSIAKAIDSYKLVVNISTVPVGTVERIGSIVKSHLTKNVDFDIAANPEFLREGSAIKDRLHPARIVIGAESDKAIERLKEVYKPIDAPIIVTNIKTAEMIKYASNAFLATKISFINEIAFICEAVGADVRQVAQGMGYDNRIGREFLEAGLGYGGSCFPKDTRALDQIAFEQGYNFTLLKAVITVNHMQRVRIVHKARKALGTIENKIIGILGLAFKPNTDDMREAASLDIISYLESEGALVKAYDPVAMEKAKQYLTDVTFCQDAYSVCENADAVIVVTEWDEFRNLDLKKVKSLMRQPIIVDGRNIYDIEVARSLGFTYFGVGR